MRNLLCGLAAALALVCPRAAYAVVDTYVQMNPTPANYVAGGSATLTLSGTSTTCGAGAIVFPVTSAGMAQIGVSGTFTSGSLLVAATANGSAFTSAMKLEPRTGGAQVTGITSTGQWTIQVRADTGLCVYSSSFSGAVTIAVRLVPWVTHLQVIPFKSNIAGSQVACNSGTSPCTVSNTAVDILNNNDARKACSLRVVGAVDLYCKRKTAALGAATASSFDFMLTQGSGALKGGDSWLCHDAGVVWTGPINCIASGASAVVDLAVSETE